MKHDLLTDDMKSKEINSFMIWINWCFYKETGMPMSYTQLNPCGKIINFPATVTVYLLYVCDILSGC